MTARSPSDILFGVSVADWTCMPRDLERCVHDRAAIGRVRLDQFAHPFRIEQIFEALWRVFLLHQVGVVGERRDQNSRRYMQPLRGVVALVEMPHDLFRQVWCEPTAAFPDYAMRLVCGVDDVDSVDVGGILLTDASKNALGTGSLHAHNDAGKLRLECLAEAFRELQVHRRVKRKLAFFFRRLDQGRRHRFRRRRRDDPHGEGAEAKRPSAFEHIAYSTSCSLSRFFGWCARALYPLARGCRRIWRGEG